ncbi:MAG: alpha/beta hydrolase [Chloroflexaceae bacterium]|nr:alpha/beta hydrolase [Chloroflexaceae bacterium]
MHHKTGTSLRKRPRHRWFKTFLTPPLVAGLGWIAYSNLAISHHMPLPPAVSGEQRIFQGKAGKLCAYMAGEGEGPPLLLIHSVNAAASAYEMRPLFEHYRQSRRVYALDLPGFGFSDRSKRSYTPRLMTDAVLDVLDLIAREAGPGPVDAVALSLGAEFLARAANEAPDRFRTLALISPTGLRKGERRQGAAGTTLGNPLVQELFDFPLWSRPFFDLLNSRPSQRFFMSRAFSSYEALDQDLMDYYYLTAHQPGAQNAPYAFVSGGLFSADMDHVYHALTMPVWLGYGTRGEFSDVHTEKVATRRNWTIQAFPTGAMPHFEQPESFIQAYEAFLQRES